MIETKDDALKALDYSICFVEYGEDDGAMFSEHPAKSKIRDCKEFITELDQAYSIAIEGLKKIAGQDFRGNRPNECVLAYETLKKLGEA